MDGPPADSLVDAAPLAEFAVPVPPIPDRFHDVWRQLHYAAQVPVNLGKRWAVAHDDDSHTSLVYDDDAFAWVNSAADGSGPTLEALIDLQRTTVTVARADDAGVSETLQLDGLRLEDARDWLDEIAHALADRPAKRPALPAPDLPRHEVATEGLFRFDDRRDETRAVDACYTRTAEMLARLVRMVEAADAGLSVAQLGVDLDAKSAKPVPCRLWPHHFDLASLFVAKREENDRPVRTIGVGLAPPDELERSGYFYVAPWTDDGSTPDEERFVKPPYGRWVWRAGEHLAVLPLRELWSLTDEADRGAATANFIAAALTAANHAIA